MSVKKPALSFSVSQKTSGEKRTNMLLDTMETFYWIWGYERGNNKKNLTKGYSQISKMNDWNDRENRELTGELSFPNSLSEVPGFLWILRKWLNFMFFHFELLGRKYIKSNFCYNHLFTLYCVLRELQNPETI